MLGLPPTVRIHFAVGLVDMRKGIDGLRTIVDGVLKRDPFEGHLFVFVGKSRDKVKILFWDRNGFVVYMKRLERGRFQMPVVDEKRRCVEMEGTQLAMLLDGIDLNAQRLPRWRRIDRDGDRRRSSIVIEGRDGHPPVDHDCVLKDIVVAQADRIAKLEHQVSLLVKAHVGPKSERAKVPKKPKTKPTPEETAAKRRHNATQKAALATTTTTLTVPEAQRSCPHCRNSKLKPVGNGTTTTIWEFVPATFIRHDYVQETLRCSCNGYIVKAPPPKKVVERGKYGASFLAHLVVARVRRPPAALPPRERVRAHRRARRALDDERAAARGGIEAEAYRDGAARSPEGPSRRHGRRDAHAHARRR